MARTNKVIDLARKNQWPIWTLLTVTAIVASLWAPQLTAQFARDQSVGRTLRLVLNPWGFEPDEITITPGPIGIEVRNRVGFPDLDLHFELEQGADKPRVSLFQERFSRELPKWRNVFVLPAGVYVVSVAGNEKWVSHITVKDDAAKQ